MTPGIKSHVRELEEEIDGLKARIEVLRAVSDTDAEEMERLRAEIERLNGIVTRYRNRIDSNLWRAKALEYRQELVKANKGLRRLRFNLLRSRAGSDNGEEMERLREENTFLHKTIREQAAVVRELEGELEANDSTEIQRLRAENAAMRKQLVERKDMVPSKPTSSTCSTCSEWEKDSIYVEEPKGFCPVFDKWTVASHGTHCTAHKPILPDKAITKENNHDQPKNPPTALKDARTEVRQRMEGAETR